MDKEGKGLEVLRDGSELWPEIKNQELSIILKERIDKQKRLSVKYRFRGFYLLQIQSGKGSV